MACKSLWTSSGLRIGLEIISLIYLYLFMYSYFIIYFIYIYLCNRFICPIHKGYVANALITQTPERRWYALTLRLRARWGGSSLLRARSFWNSSRIASMVSRVAAFFSSANVSFLSYSAFCFASSILHDKAHQHMQNQCKTLLTLCTLSHINTTPTTMTCVIKIKRYVT